MKKLLALGLTACCLTAIDVQAQPGAPAADIAAGQQRAAACFACHNANGIAQIPGTPHLAGQERGYLERRCAPTATPALARNPP